MSLTQTDIHNAVRNEYDDKSFVLGGRVFPVKDLAYDDYLEFITLAKPIVEAVASSLEVTALADGLPDVQLNPLSIDVGSLLKLAGHELPRLAWLCCKQSDPNITVVEVKRLARRPHVLLEVVLAQVRHNELVKEFADFFPRLGKIVAAMIPEMPGSTTEETRSSS